MKQRKTPNKNIEEWQREILKTVLLWENITYALWAVFVLWMLYYSDTWKETNQNNYPDLKDNTIIVDTIACPNAGQSVGTEYMYYGDSALVVQDTKTWLRDTICSKKVPLATPYETMPTR